MLYIFWCYFYDVRLRLWMWEVLVKWSLLLCGYFVFFKKRIVDRPGLPGYVDWHDTKSARGLIFGPKARHAGRWGTARQARGLSRHGTLRPVPSPARWPSILPSSNLGHRLGRGAWYCHRGLYVKLFWLPVPSRVSSHLFFARRNASSQQRHKPLTFLKP